MRDVKSKKAADRIKAQRLIHSQTTNEIVQLLRFTEADISQHDEGSKKYQHLDLVRCWLWNELETRFAMTDAFDTWMSDHRQKMTYTDYLIKSLPDSALH